MTKLESFRDLLVWQKAMDLTVAVYKATSSFPRDERFGLINQLQRSAVSVPSNISEGYGRGTRPDYVHFLEMARGSLNEVQTQLILAERLGFANKQLLANANLLWDECSRLLHGLIVSLK